MNEYFELGLVSYNVMPDERVSVVFSDNVGLEYVNNISLEQDCVQYDNEVVENLRKYIVCYCAHFGGNILEGKKLVYDLSEPNGNIVRIV
jgi:hypothetical protein